MQQTLLGVLALSFTLSLDALAVGIGYGIGQVRIPFLSKMTLCMFSIIFTGLSMLAGSLISGLMAVNTAKLIGIGLLFTSGLWFALKDIKFKKPATVAEQPVTQHGITVAAAVKAVQDPETSDLDNSGRIDILESILLSFALSSDALGAGFGAALTGMRTFELPLFTGLFQLTFIYLGLYSGKRLSNTSFVKNIKNWMLSAAPGVLLMLMAIIKLFELKL